jgi:hypothetical protein
MGSRGLMGREGTWPDAHRRGFMCMIVSRQDTTILNPLLMEPCVSGVC